MNLSVKKLPEIEVAYMRHVGSYLDTKQVWTKLGVWTDKHQLYPTEQYFIGISLDDPNMVDEFACRYDACVTIPNGFQKEEDSEIRYKKLAGGLYVLYQFYDTIDKLAITYQSIYSGWFPMSEYEADDRPCLEFCIILFMIQNGNVR